MKKTVKILSAILAILLPFVFTFSVAFLTPPVYDETFVGALSKKYERLTSIDEPKIVIVGGSSVAFGIDSELIEKTLDMPVVNFGLYAALGTKFMMDLSKSSIKKGDVVVLSPELDPQTLSLYFNGDTAIKAMDGYSKMLLSLPMDDVLKVSAASFRFASEKLKYLMRGEKSLPDASSAYASQYVNEYGDVTYQRLCNVMTSYYDTTTPVNLNTSIFDEEFIDYVNDYVKFCKHRGATVYFGYCPINEAAVVYPEFMSKGDTYINFDVNLSLLLDCDVLGTVKDAVMGAGYFYDSNFHLNDFGVTVHTVDLIKNLAREMDMNVKINVTIPEEPKLDSKDYAYEGMDDNAKYFTFERDINEKFGIVGGYVITGLSDLGKTQTTLTLPVAFEGVRTTYLGSNALSGGCVETLIVPSEFEDFISDDGDGNLLTQEVVFNFQDNCFANANALTKVYIYNHYESTLMPPTNFGKSDVSFHIPASVNFDGYFWGELGISFIDDLTME